MISQHHSVPKHLSAGFTLVELMITIAIASILAVLAAPSFQSLIASQRIRTASFDLVSDLTFARSEAIKQNDNVTVASASGTNAWANGWNISSAGGAIKTSSVYRQITITTGVGGAANVIYNRSGRLTANTAVSFQINDASPNSGVQASCVTVGITGQPTSKKGNCS